MPAALVIGHFRRERDRYVGRVVTLSLQADVVIAPAGRARWIAHAGGAQLGRGEEIAGGGSRLIRLELDDPSFSVAIVAELVAVADPDPHAYQLVWSRELKAAA